MCHVCYYSHNLSCCVISEMTANKRQQYHESNSIDEVQKSVGVAAAELECELSGCVVSEMGGRDGGRA